VQSYVVGRDVAGGVADRFDVQAGARTEVVEALAEHVAAHRQVRAVELEHDARPVDLVVLDLHRVGQREHVLLVRGVMPVLEEDRDNAGRRGGQECVLDVGAVECVLQIGDVRAHSVETSVGDRPDARRHGEVDAAHDAPHVLGELGHIGGQPRHAGLAAEAVEALLDVRRVSDLALLAIVDNADAGLDLTPHDGGHRRADLLVEAFDAGLAPVSELQRREQLRRPRQAAGVRGQDVLGRALHGSLLACRTRDTLTSPLTWATRRPPACRRRPESRC
jgi:hypothetical protein